MDTADGVKNTIYEIILEKVRNSGLSVKEPLIGFANPQDPLFIKLQALQPHHILPEEILHNAKTVVAFYIPFGNGIAASNQGGVEVSEKWARAYIETNTLINTICEALAVGLKEIGVRTAYQKATHNFDEKILIAPWSHKSVAYIAGLGTFGVHKMLITPMGCAGRIGSVVIDHEIASTKRPEKEYCLHYQGKSCLRCIASCPISVLTEDSLDKPRCYQRLLDVANTHSSLGFADVCGKCISVCANLRSQ